MKKVMFGLMIILLLFILILPVMADEPLVTVDAVCPTTVCVGEEFSCTLTTTYAGPDNIDVEISDFYPSSMTNIKYSGSGYHYGGPSYRVDWNYGKVINEFTATETITMTPTTTDPGQHSRIIGYWVDETPTLPTAMITEDYTLPITVNYCNGGTPAPEFPSAFFPATMIIGFLGAVLLIQRTREH